jgi:type II secretory pathway pseudopilin PulG
VIGIMAAVLSPMVLNYIDDAKMTKAGSDVKTIGGLLMTLTKDVQHFPMYTDGTTTTGDPTIYLLRGPGNNPADGTGPLAWGVLGTNVGELDNHLVKNAPGGIKYATSGRFFWKGPYLEKVNEDAWGNRYLVNIKNGNPGDPDKKVIWVLSAGPNGKIETNPNALTDSGPAAGGDDIAIRIR